MRSTLAALGGALVLVLACNAITGIGDLDPSAVAEAGAPPPGDGGGEGEGDGGAPPPPATCACAPVAPEGWSGPMAVLEAAGEAAPSCPGREVAFSGGLEPSAPAGCTACTCGAPDATCGFALTMHDEPGCQPVEECGKHTLAPGDCKRITYCGPVGSAGLTGIVADGGCAPDGGAPAPVTWGRRAAACTATVFEDRGCPGGETCSPGVFGSRACILHAGDVACPAGPYQGRTLYYGSVADDRACEPCTCDPPSGVTCTGGTVTFYSNTSCTANPQVENGSGCHTVEAEGPPGSAKITAPAAASGGSCAPKGGAPKDGGVAPADPTTVCCLP